MRILIVASNTTGRFSPFVQEQVKSLSLPGVEFDYFGISQKGMMGYLKCRSTLMRKIEQYKPDIIHAHYGLSGLLANLQRQIPVITTFHGSDIHSKGFLLLLSRVCMRLSAFNIFVSTRIYKESGYPKKNYIIQPCGTDIRTFCTLSWCDARRSLGWSQDEKYVLFAGAFENQVKNSTLAQKAVSLVNGCRLIELKGYSRTEVNLLMNACDCLLMTSDREASPMVIKEAMLCGCPIVSVDVGDVKEMVSGIEGCYMADRNPGDIANKLFQAFAFKGKTAGRDRIIQLGLELSVVAGRIQTVYNKVNKQEIKIKQ